MKTFDDTDLPNKPIPPTPPEIPPDAPEPLVNATAGADICRVLSAGRPVNELSHPGEIAFYSDGRAPVDARVDPLGVPPAAALDGRGTL
jgi:hypothetical protein